MAWQSLLQSCCYARLFGSMARLSSGLFSSFRVRVHLYVQPGQCKFYALRRKYNYSNASSYFQLYKLVNRTPGVKEFFTHTYVWPFTWLFGRILINVSMAQAFLTFGLVKKSIWIKVRLLGHLYAGKSNRNSDMSETVHNFLCKFQPVLALYCWAYIAHFIVIPIVLIVLAQILPKKSSAELKHASSSSKSKKEL